MSVASTRVALEIVFAETGYYPAGFFTHAGRRLLHEFPDVAGKDVELIYFCLPHQARTAALELRTLAYLLTVRGGALSVRFVPMEQHVPEGAPRNPLSQWHWVVLDEAPDGAVVLRLGPQAPVRVRRADMERVAWDMQDIAYRLVQPEELGPPVRVDAAVFRLVIEGVEVYAAREHMAELAMVLDDILALAEREVARCA
jgi:hypothetical protein